MRISTEIGSIANRVGEEKAIEFVAKAGFDAWDFSMFRMMKYNKKEMIALPDPPDHPLGGTDYAAYARKLRSIGEKYGISCNQSHAPFPDTVPEIVGMLPRAIECTAIAGAKICVIHPFNHKTAEENAEFFKELLPYAKKFGVKIATENMWNTDPVTKLPCSAACSSPADFLAHLETIDDRDFVACLDIGHAEMEGTHTSAPEMIRALGSRLQAIHLHDNDLVHDLHRIPFSGQIDFRGVISALKEIGYAGDLTLEADRHLADFPDDRVFDGVKELAEAANRLRDLWNEI